MSIFEFSVRCERNSKSAMNTLPKEIYLLVDLSINKSFVWRPKLTLCHFMHRLDHLVKTFETVRICTFSIVVRISSYLQINPI